MVTSVFCDLHQMLKPNLWQREELPVQFFSTYWVLIRSDEKKKSVVYFDFAIIIYIYIYSRGICETPNEEVKAMSTKDKV